MQGPLAIVDDCRHRAWIAQDQKTSRFLVDLTLNPQINLLSKSTQCRCQKTVFLVGFHPFPGTVTYLTDCGAPTLILQCRNSLRPSETANVYGSLAGVGTNDVWSQYMDDYGWLYKLGNPVAVFYEKNGKPNKHQSRMISFWSRVLYFQADPWKHMKTHIRVALCGYYMLFYDYPYNSKKCCVFSTC